MHPHTYRLIYFGFKHIVCRFTPLYNFVNSIGRKAKGNTTPHKKVVKLVEDKQPDLILSTWSKAAKVAGNVDVDVYVTDFGAHRGWVSANAAHYIVADTNVKEKLVSFGVPKNKILVQGIPLKKMFQNQKHHAYGSQNILIMGGGLGIAPWVDELLEELTKYKNFHITLITGKNKGLYKRISTHFPSVNVVGFTNEMNKYLKEASVVISKPGGVSLAESIAMGVPFIAVYPEFEHEKENARYIEEHHYGAVIYKGQSINQTIMRYLFLDYGFTPIEYTIKEEEEENKEASAYEMAV